MDNLKKIVIAIDGPAASGKSTTAKLVARRLGYLHIDTGAMYRAITLKVLEQKVSVEDSRRVGALAEQTEIRLEQNKETPIVFLDNRDVTSAIRTPEVTKHVSLISSYPQVREVLVREQRKMSRGGGVVLEGRDIGTVVLPDADLKIFMVASISTRAKRRMVDLKQAGFEVSENTIVNEISERDKKDASREASPLRCADDAIKLDTTHLTIEQQVDLIVEKARIVIAERESSEGNRR